MALHNASQALTLDDIGRQILAELQEDGRISFNELARKVNLSAPAVAERVRRMEQVGIITGYRAVVDPTKVGLGITAYVRLTVFGGTAKRIPRLIEDLPEARECHHVTGEDCFIIKLSVGSVAELEAVIERLNRHGQPATSVVLSSPLEYRSISV